jgi:hypothetical protein
MSTLSGIASAFFVAASIATPSTLPLKDFSLNSRNRSESSVEQDKRGSNIKNIN